MGVGHLDVVNSAGPRLGEEEESTEPRDILESRDISLASSICTASRMVFTYRRGRRESPRKPRNFLYSKSKLEYCPIYSRSAEK